MVESNLYVLYFTSVLPLVVIMFNGFIVGILMQEWIFLILNAGMQLAVLQFSLLIFRVRSYKPFTTVKQ